MNGLAMITIEEERRADAADEDFNDHCRRNAVIDASEVELALRRVRELLGDGRARDPAETARLLGVLARLEKLREDRR